MSIYHSCKTCGGTGKVTSMKTTGKMTIPVEKQCSTCKGKGRFLGPLK